MGIVLMWITVLAFAVTLGTIWNGLERWDESRKSNHPSNNHKH